MSSSIHYHSMQQNSQPNLYSYQQQQQQQQHRHHRHHHHHHHHHHHPQTPQIHNMSSHSNHRLNSSSHPTPITTPLVSVSQSSAYFLERIDLENYTSHTLKQTVETILSKTKSKGLKVRISLPDDGLIIENITDPSQSWIFKTSELLYFWRDPYYLNVIIVVTINRSRNHSNRPYSASVFRLRGGTDSAQLFLQQAQQFFSNLSTLTNSNTSKSIQNQSVEKVARPDNRNLSSSTSSNNNNNNNNNTTQKTKARSLAIINETKTTNDQTPGIRRVTRAEFDPGKTTAAIHSVDQIPQQRTISETASSTDSQITNTTREVLSYTRKLNDDDDDKMTTISNNLSIDQVVELMRELKELRSEIASLKLAKKMPPVTRSMSTSPLAVQTKKLKDSSTTPTTSSPSFPDATSQSEMDAETQTDSSVINQRRRQILRKNKKTMIGSGGVVNLNKKKIPPSTARNGRRTLSNSSTNTLSEQEEPSADRSSHVNDPTHDTNSMLIQEPYQPIILATPPRPVLMRNQTNFASLANAASYLNSTEEPSAPIVAEKEKSTFLSTNHSSSKSDILGPALPNPSVGPSNYRLPVDNSSNPTEHIYENIPILIQSNSNRESYYNIPIINADDTKQPAQPDDYGYYTINKNNNHHRENGSQQQYLIPGQVISNSPPTTDTNPSDMPSPPKPQIISAGRHRNQPIYFANHLTNPVFNVDKQLLINTIANQFGVDLNSPQLQQLISNQHLFVARKRTFANMVWQLTPDEETALCSSPVAAQISNFIDIEPVNSHHSTARPILKANKRFHAASKRRTITWDNALE